MTTTNFAMPAAAVTVLVYLGGRTRVRVAKSLSTDKEGRLWATVAGLGRARKRLVLAFA
jgi:hypothetical protein